MEAAATERIESKVFDFIATVGPDREEITRDASLDALDVDSLDVVEVAQMAEAEFEVPIDPERFVGSKTAGDLAGVVSTIVAEATA
jgi:acyl carrier protein